MPKLGLTMEEGLLVEWQKAEGDTVSAGEVLFVLETEKVTYDVEAAEDGVLGRILVPAGQTVAVGSVVGWLLKEGESAEDLPEAAEISAPPPPEEAPPAEPPAQVQSTAPTSGRVRATPLAKKLAREMGLDLTLVTGSGSAGRVLAADVRAAAQTRPSLAPVGEERLVPHSGMRRAIARNMMHSKLETAQTYMSLTADAGAIVSHRQALLEHVEQTHGARLTITDLFMKVTGAAIAAHPVINTRWSENGVTFLPEVHMGMAMALDEGLIVPVIKSINRKTLGQVAAERVALIERCRAGKFLPDDISGSTFTLSAMGMFGIESFTANINASEAAILAVGAIIEKPVAISGQIVIRPVVNLTLTYDHRIIDGAEAGKFMQTLKGLVEEPVKLLALGVAYG